MSSVREDWIDLVKREAAIESGTELERTFNEWAERQPIERISLSRWKEVVGYENHKG